MFKSNYQLVQEPNEAGVSIYCFKPGTREVADVVRTPVPASSELVKLFNDAPEDDWAARDWVIRADARDVNTRLFKWLREGQTGGDPEIKNQQASGVDNAHPATAAVV